MTESKKYLTVHGHFYQPPRENPWLEQIEEQDSAKPYHDWNERICAECYSPNSISKIVGNNSKVLDIVNNYCYMSFNMGPTLLSWMEKFHPQVYERIIKADIDSIKEFNGHGSAIAQVYNHIIMPLANENDKYTQVYWGIEDFKKRFGRQPEGLWLAETACDDETLGILSDFGIKYTILSPYQAQKVLYKNTKEYIDVSDGSIDTTKPYKYNIKSRQERTINIFFYNAQISQAVAFEELLKDGVRFIEKIKTGIRREGNCLINIATDGESYGHHTKFGDMALSYVLRIKAHDEGFLLTNYGQYLEMFPAEDEVVIKPVSSWSCCHGVQRWQNDCGCSTGGLEGWNQKWRKPLRQALNLLRDKLIKICEKEGLKYFYDLWEARNKYIQVILSNRSEDSLKEFFERNTVKDIDKQGKINAIKIMEIQRQTLLMYTSCGWFFNDISGIETIQILKYAARAVQLASDFTKEDLEAEFIEVLKEAKSNIPEYGSGKDIWEHYVKPCIIDYGQIASLWAFNALYENSDGETDLCCYKVKCVNTKIVRKGDTKLLTGHIEITSNITLKSKDIMFVLLQFAEGDFHCTVRNFDGRYTDITKDLIETYQNYTPTETIRLLDKYFGKEFYTLKDIFFEDRQKISNHLTEKQMKKIKDVYSDVYNGSREAILHFGKLGFKVPFEFKTAAQYTLSENFNKIFTQDSGIQFEEKALQRAEDIILEAKALDIRLYKKPTELFFSVEILKSVKDFVKKYDTNKLDNCIEVFKTVEKLEINPDITEAQNVYFQGVYRNFAKIVSEITKNVNERENKEFLLKMLNLGDKLNIDTEFYRNIIIKATERNVV